MEILKKNMILCVALSVALLISIVLAFFVFQTYMSMKKYQAELVVQRDKIKKLIEEKPAPIKGNLDAILVDSTILQKKVMSLHLVFGKPYREAIQAFAEELGTDEFALYSKWKAIAEKEKKTSTPEEALKKLLKEFDEEKIEKALEAFRKVLGKRTLEDINPITVGPLLIEGLGTYRNFSPEICKTYMVSIMEKKLDELANSKNVGLGKVIALPDKFNFYNIAYEGQRMPAQEHIPLVLKHYKIIEDIMFRMKESGITAIKTLSKSSLEGVENRGYQTFTYTLALSGNMENIKSFINGFQDAYKDNRIYVIKDLSLKKSLDEMKNIIQQASTGNAVTSPDPTAPSMMPPGLGGVPGKAKAKKDESYGVVQIGTSSDVTLDMKLDYVIYVADEIKWRR